MCQQARSALDLIINSCYLIVNQTTMWNKEDKPIGTTGANFNEHKLQKVFIQGNAFQILICHKMVAILLGPQYVKYLI